MHCLSILREREREGGKGERKNERKREGREREGGREREIEKREREGGKGERERVREVGEGEWERERVQCIYLDDSAPRSLCEIISPLLGCIINVS